MTIEFRAAAGASGDDHALTTPAAAKALTCARNRGNSSSVAHGKLAAWADDSTRRCRHADGTACGRRPLPGWRESHHADAGLDRTPKPLGGNRQTPSEDTGVAVEQVLLTV